MTDVAMESTGVYWKPIYYLLEDDFTLLPSHIKLTFRTSRGPFGSPLVGGQRFADRGGSGGAV